MSRSRHQRPATDASAVRPLLIGIALLFLFVFVLLPLISVFLQALDRGVLAYAAAVTDTAALASFRLTLVCCLLALPMSVAFGLAAAWALTRFQFRGRNLLLTLIDLPFAISPVVAGMMLVSLYGTHGVLGSWLEDRGVQVIFAFPGVVLATALVTLPFIARELTPVLQARGCEQEECARLLGASGWQIFLRITLPNVRWALLYGTILAAARAWGEFGAVSVVSGHIRGVTNTVPLHVQLLYEEFNFQGAFAVASLLSLLAVLSLGLRSLVAWRQHCDLSRRTVHDEN